MPFAYNLKPWRKEVINGKVSIDTAPSSRKIKDQPPVGDKSKKGNPPLVTKVCKPNRFDTYLGSKYYYTEIFKD